MHVYNITVLKFNNKASNEQLRIFLLKKGAALCVGTWLWANATYSLNQTQLATKIRTVSQLRTSIHDPLNITSTISLYIY